jgi:hypothetical protein
VIAVAALALALAGCGDDGGGSDAPTAGGEQTVHLRVVARDRGGKTHEAGIVCNRDEGAAFDGTVKGFEEDVDPGTLCRAALGLAPFLSAKPDLKRACTQVYGGPETAHITGTIRGRRIDRRFSRTDGCQISDWDRAQVLIPIKAR